MDGTFPLLIAAAVGFSHAFEADHLVAVGNIVTKRDRLIMAIKDGIYWGLGHTSTILIIGLVMLVGKATFLNGYFGYFEALVGLMLIVLGLVRMSKFWQNKQNEIEDLKFEQTHHLAYGVGLVHGLAGSGAMILLVMAEIKSNFDSMIYLLIFGIGSVVGMLVAAGIFSLPFSKKWSKNSNFQFVLVFVSSLLCIGYGAFLLIENLI